jgi:hypothetical protein
MDKHIKPQNTRPCVITCLLVTKKSKNCSTAVATPSWGTRQGIPNIWRPELASTAKVKTFLNKGIQTIQFQKNLPKYNRTKSWILIYMHNKRHLNSPCDSFSSDCMAVLDHLNVDVVLTNAMKQNIQCFMNYQQVIISTSQDLTISFLLQSSTEDPSSDKTFPVLISIY